MRIPQIAPDSPRTPSPAHGCYVISYSLLLNDCSTNIVLHVSMDHPLTRAIGPIHTTLSFVFPDAQQLAVLCIPFAIDPRRWGAIRGRSSPPIHLALGIYSMVFCPSTTLIRCCYLLRGTRMVFGCLPRGWRRSSVDHAATRPGFLTPRAPRPETYIKRPSYATDVRLFTPHSTVNRHTTSPPPNVTSDRCCIYDFTDTTVFHDSLNILPCGRPFLCIRR